ncbi:hypothetical protein Q5752_005963 [Cryptotrichosporon argae]
MTSVVKGFPAPQINSAHRPAPRPFTNGSMTVDTSTLTALDSLSPAHTNPVPGPYAMPNSLPTHFAYPLVSPRNDVLELPPNPSHSFQPHAMFSQFGFGGENREPPVSVPAHASHAHAPSSPDRSRSQSSSRSSLLGKAATSRARPHRKQSMSDARPSSVAAQPRGRLMQAPRSQSFQAQSSFAFGNLAPAGTDMASPDFNIGRHFGFPLGYGGNPEWQPGSAPSLLHGGMPGYGASLEESALESPMTPAQDLHPAMPSADETKKQRRRESHNQVEKRRREHINLMIDQLSKLLPLRYQQMNAPAEAIEEDDDEAVGDQSPSKRKKSKRSMSSSKAQKDSTQNKGQVLSNSVDYIMRLQEAVTKQQATIKGYEDMLGIKGPTPDLLGALAFSPPPIWPSVGLGLSGPSLQTPQYARPDAFAFDPQQLQVMRGSPEPEQTSQPDASVTTWEQISAAAQDGIMSFDRSPAPKYRRSDSASFSISSPDTDNKDRVWDVLDLLHKPAATSSAGDPSPSRSSDEQRARSLQQSFAVDMDMMIDEVRQDVGEGWQ